MNKNITMRSSIQPGGVLYEVVNKAGAVVWGHFVPFGKRWRSRRLSAAQEQERVAFATLKKEQLHELEERHEKSLPR